MAFDWAEYLHLAKELGQRTEEASRRSAISRAYYAVFGKACGKLRDEGIAVPAFGVHDFVWNQYQTDSDPVRRDIGIKGDRLKRARRNADYDAHFPALDALLKSALLQAENLVKALDSLAD